MWFLALLLTACVAPPEQPASAEGVVHPEPRSWPGSALDLLIPPGPAVDRPIRVYLDPGHGAGSNVGNRGARCQSEEDAMFELAVDLEGRLKALGPFEIRSARPDGRRTKYERRVAEANDWKADVLVSLHSDARGSSWTWEPFPGWGCIRNDADPGFAVLVSDRGSPGAVASRAELANAVATRLSQAGFGAYDGEDYGALYDLGSVPGTFLDRRGLMMLRRPEMPSVIIETHNAFDLNEVRRWDEDRTREAFARAVAHAILDVVVAPI